MRSHLWRLRNPIRPSPRAKVDLLLRLCHRAQLSRPRLLLLHLLARPPVIQLQGKSDHFHSRLSSIFFCSNSVLKKIQLPFILNVKMTPDPEETEGSRMVGVQQQQQQQREEGGEEQVVVKNCSNQKKFFVCRNCNQKKKSILRSSTTEQTESAASVVRPSKNEVRVCKKCRKSSSSDPAATGSTTTTTSTTEKKKRRSVATVVFHPHWTHYCFLLAIYLVFSVILYYLTLNQQQSE